jgi:hypothetical protein
MLYSLRIIDQVLCGFVILTKGIIPSVLKASPHLSWTFGLLRMVNVEGFPLSGVHGVLKLPNLLVPIRHDMPDYELSIS